MCSVIAHPTIRREYASWMAARDTFALMIGELAQPGKGTAYNHHATYVDLATAKHGSQVDVRA
jgi:hypothetical protein